MKKVKKILLMFLAIISVGALTSCGTKETTTKELTFADVLKKVEVGLGEKTTVDKQEFLSSRSATLPSNSKESLSRSETRINLYVNQTIKINKIEFDVTFGDCYVGSHKDGFDMSIEYGIFYTGNLGGLANSDLNFIYEKYETGKSYHFILDFTEIKECDTKGDIIIDFDFDSTNMFCHHEAYITNFDIDFTKVE